MDGLQRAEIVSQDGDVLGSLRPKSGRWIGGVEPWESEAMEFTGEGADRE